MQLSLAQLYSARCTQQHPRRVASHRIKNVSMNSFSGPARRAHPSGHTAITPRLFGNDAMIQTSTERGSFHTLLTRGGGGRRGRGESFKRNLTDTRTNSSPVLNASTREKLNEIGQMVGSFKPRMGAGAEVFAYSSASAESLMHCAVLAVTRDALSPLQPSHM